MKSKKTLAQLEAEFEKAKKARDFTNKPSNKNYWRGVARQLERQIVALKRLTK